MLRRYNEIAVIWGGWWSMWLTVFKKRDGQVLVLAAVLLPVLFGMTALVLMLNFWLSRQVSLQYSRPTAALAEGLSSMAAVLESDQRQNTRRYLCGKNNPVKQRMQ